MLLRGRHNAPGRTVAPTVPAAFSTPGNQYHVGPRPHGRISSGRRTAFARWVTSLPRAPEAVTVAVDGKTSKQGHDADGEPVHMLNVFAHELNLCLAQFPVTGGKPTEPQALKHGLKELLHHYPFIRLFSNALSFKAGLASVTDSTAGVIRHEGLHWLQDQFIPGITARLPFWLVEGWPDFIGQSRSPAVKKNVVCNTPARVEPIPYA